MRISKETAKSDQRSLDQIKKPTDPRLRQVWDETFDHCRNKLKFSQQEAIQWADRSVEVAEEMQAENA